MPFYPILVNLQGQKAVVVGGGKVAQRKIETLLECGASVHVIAKELTPTLRQYVKKGEIEYRRTEFRQSDLNGAFIVIAATDDPEVNRRVSHEARGKGLLVNAVDQPADCNFIVPSVVRRGDLLISVSTSGKSPALARKIRQRLEKGFGKEYEALLILMGRLRQEVLSEGLSQDENRRIFQKLAHSRLLEAIRGKDWDRVAAILHDVLQRPVSPEDVMNYLKVE